MDYYVFFSNRIEILFSNLKKLLFDKSTTAFTKRIVVVPNQAMKKWISLELARDLSVSAGIDFYLLSSMMENLNKFSGVGVPSLFELALCIETEIKDIIGIFCALDYEKQRIWKPVMDYLKINFVESNFSFSRKTQKRLVLLSEYLADLFLKYGLYAGKMVERWEKQDGASWQQELWKIIKESWSCKPELFKDLNVHIHIFWAEFFTIFTAFVF